MEAQVATGNRKIQVTPLDIMKEQGLDITPLDKPSTGMSKATRDRLRRAKLKKTAPKPKSTSTGTSGMKKQKVTTPPEEETPLDVIIYSDSEVVDSAEEA